MIVWIGTSQEPNRDRGCTSISALKLKYKIFRDKQLSNLLNAGLGRLKRPSKGQGYCHPKLWWRDMVMVYCRIFDTGCFEHVSQNKRCAQESARRSNFLLPHRCIIMGHYIAHIVSISILSCIPYLCLRLLPLTMAVVVPSWEELEPDRSHRTDESVR